MSHYGRKGKTPYTYPGWVTDPDRAIPEEIQKQLAVARECTARENELWFRNRYYEDDYDC
jgi:hypothetical protein